MLVEWLAHVNGSRIWRQSVRVRDMELLPPTLDRWVALQAHRFGLMGTAEFDFFQSSIRSHWHIADVGANQGLYSVYFSKRAVEGRVYAFEPDPELFTALKGNIERNSAANVTLFNAAVGNQTRKLLLRSGQFNRGDNRIVPGNTSRPGTIDVDAISLDKAIPNRHLDLLKVDVQGFEVEVLRGAKQVIQANHDLLIFLEFWPQGLRNAGSGPEELLDILGKAEFSLFQHGKADKYEPFTYRAPEWSRPAQFCNLVATRRGIAPILNPG